MIRLIKNYTMDDIIAAVKRLTSLGVESAALQSLAREIIASSPAPRYPMMAVHEWAARNIEYTSDTALLANFPVAQPGDTELFTSPARMAEHYYLGHRLAADCDCTSLFISAALRTLGVPTRFAILDMHGRGYDHAAVYGYSEKATTWLFIDGTVAGAPVGMQPSYFRQILVN